MFDKIKDIIEEQLDIVGQGKITVDSSMTDDLKADSLDAAQIIMAIEEEFDIEIPDDTALSFRTIKDILTYVEQNA
ncbi:acyl carrier protein [Fusibacter sp. JL216-2]|uniref:acyl carrier protein n=1 Tax=Fusibacter sp. JL216-2 TaxID=3071453 RepID=UPI003D33F35A